MAHTLTCDVPLCGTHQAMPLASIGRIPPSSWLVLDDITICPKHQRVAVMVDCVETAVHVGNGRTGQWVRPDVAELAAVVRAVTGSL